jgi:hypothetical protein
VVPVPADALPVRNASAIVGWSITVEVASWKAPARNAGLVSPARVNACSSLSR